MKWKPFKNYKTKGKKYVCKTVDNKLKLLTFNGRLFVDENNKLFDVVSFLTTDDYINLRFDKCKGYIINYLYDNIKDYYSTNNVIYDDSKMYDTIDVSNMYYVDNSDVEASIDEFINVLFSYDNIKSKIDFITDKTILENKEYVVKLNNETDICYYNGSDFIKNKIIVQPTSWLFHNCSQELNITSIKGDFLNFLYEQYTDIIEDELTLKEIKSKDEFGNYKYSFKIDGLPKVKIKNKILTINELLKQDINFNFKTN